MVENTRAFLFTGINFSLPSAFNASLKTCMFEMRLDEYNVLTNINWH